MSSADLVPSCEECAACCTGGGDHYVRVTGNDYERMGALAARWTHFHGNRCFMRMVGGRCAALRDATDGRRLCAIYAVRPQVCRDLERGSAQCEAERWRKV